MRPDDLVQVPQADVNLHLLEQDLDVGWPVRLRRPHVDLAQRHVERLEIVD